MLGACKGHHTRADGKSMLERKPRARSTIPLFVRLIFWFCSVITASYSSRSDVKSATWPLKFCRASNVPSGSATSARSSWR